MPPVRTPDVFAAAQAPSIHKRSGCRRAVRAERGIPQSMKEYRS
jgi:hypothetical protein